MIRLGKQIRLTSKEVERIAEITGFTPVGLKTIEDLDTYIARCKRFYWGTSQETGFLHSLVDEELAHCLGIG